MLRKHIPLAAALLLSGVVIGYAGLAQAQGVPSAVQRSQAPATRGTGASNAPNGQPAGMVMGSGNQVTGTSTGANSSNRGTGASGGMGVRSNAAMTRATHHKIRHRRRHHAH